MNKPKLSLRDENGKIYFGWWVIVMSAIIGTFAYNGIVSTSGVFILPVTMELGLSMGAFSLYMSIMSITNIVNLLIVSRFMTEKHIKKLMLLAAIVGVLAFIGFSFSSKAWHFYLLSIPMGFCFSSFTMTPCTILVNNWFGPMVRGKAMSFFMSGMSLIGVPMINILNYVVMNFGWRIGYIFSAALILLCVPITMKCAVWSPAKKGIKRMGDVDDAFIAQQQKMTQEAPGIAFKEGLRKPMTWLAFLSCALLVIVSSADLQHAIPTLVMAGYTQTFATALSSAITLALIFSGLIIGMITDKFGLRVSTIGSMVMFIIGMLGYAFLADYSWMIAPLFIGYVFGIPAVNILSPLMMSHMFGDKEIGKFIAYVNMFIAVGGIFGAPLVGYLFDYFGSYKIPWLISAGILLIATIIRAVCTSNRYKFVPQQSSDTPSE